MRTILLTMLAVLLPSAPLDRVQWIGGCWGSGGESGSYEYWMAMPGGALIGVAESRRAGRVVGHETMRIIARSDTLIYLAQPHNQPFAQFRTNTAQGDAVTFENPAHDFPKRVTYRKGPADSLHASVAGDGKAFDYRMSRIACAANDAAAERQVRALDSLWARSYATHDTVSALQIMGEDFVMTTARGVKNRALEMGDVRAQPGLLVHYFRTRDVRIRTHGEAAIVTGFAEWSTDWQGRTTDVRRAYGAVYRTGGPLGWRLVALHIAPAS